MSRQPLTPRATDTLRRWLPPDSEDAGEERGAHDDVIERLADRMVGRRTTSLNTDEAQAVALYMDLHADDHDFTAADTRLLATLNDIAGWR